MQTFAVWHGEVKFFRFWLFLSGKSFYNKIKNSKLITKDALLTVLTRLNFEGCVRYIFASLFCMSK